MTNGSGHDTEYLVNTSWVTSSHESKTLLNMWRLEKKEPSENMRGKRINDLEAFINKLCSKMPKKYGVRRAESNIGQIIFYSISNKSLPFRQKHHSSAVLPLRTLRNWANIYNLETISIF